MRSNNSHPCSLRNINGVLLHPTLEVDGTPCTLGFLIGSATTGIFATDLRLDGAPYYVTPEIAKQHNTALDEAIIEGLDFCKAGEGALFYFVPPDGNTPACIKSFLGTTVANRVKYNNRQIEFHYHGMMFSGPRPAKGEHAVAFTRFL